MSAGLDTSSKRHSPVKRPSTKSASVLPNTSTSNLSPRQSVGSRSVVYATGSELQGSTAGTTLSSTVSGSTELANRKHRQSTAQKSVSTRTQDIIIASASRESDKLPVPDAQGTIGALPLEDVHPEEMKNVPSREKNLYDTSIDGPGLLDVLSDEDKQKLLDKMLSNAADSLYPWTSIGVFSATGKGTTKTIDSRVIKAYMSENFYSDWYANTALTVGTCFFLWLFAYIGFSWWSLGFIFLTTMSLCFLEYRRFYRDVRDDLLRINVDETLSGREESMKWLNTFLAKFWVMYMPVFSQQVMEIANPILKDAAPGYGIDSLSLEEFTLGTKAPALKGVKSFTKKGKDIVEMQWSFAFTPNDTSEMTKNEIKEKVNPKISLGVTVGKGVVSKTLPVLVENINAAGNMRIAIRFGNVFPNIKIVSLQLLEPPLIDFALKPIGGDTLGLDIMSFLPGLKSFVKSMINSIAGPMLYAPNEFIVNVEDLMAQQANDAIGVLAVTLHSAQNLKGSEFIGNTVDPYIVLKTEKNLSPDTKDARTSVKSDVKNPVWDETLYVLVNSLDQKLTVSCYDFNNVRRDELIGSFEVNLNDFLQDPVLDNATSDLKSGPKVRGSLNYSMHWFPVIDPKLKELETVTSTASTATTDDSEDELIAGSSDTVAESGIAKITLEKVVDLSSCTSITRSLNPCAKLFVDNKLVKSFRTLRRSNEPMWNESIEVLVPSRSKSQVILSIYDDHVRGSTLLTKYTTNMEDLIGILESGKECVRGTPGGDIYLNVVWKPVQLTGTFSTTGGISSPMGCIRIFIDKAFVRSSLSGVGDIDPYFVVLLNKQRRYKSRHVSDCSSPIYGEFVYVPFTTKNQFITIALYDYQSVGSDRYIGSLTMPISELIKVDPTTGDVKPRDTFNDQLTSFNLKNKMNLTTKDEIYAMFSYIPVAKVYSPEELPALKELEDSLAERKLKFAETQRENQKAMETEPDKWEVVTIPDPFEEDELAVNSKAKLTLDELTAKNSGVLSLKLLSGKLSRPRSFLNILLDDILFPVHITPRFTAGSLPHETFNVFIRDLTHSKLCLRVTKKRVPKDKDHVISEYYLDTLKLLRQSYETPMDVDFFGSTVKLQAMYYPSDVEMPLEETVLDTGILKLNLVSGSHLLSADRNGKSDPFVEVYVNNKRMFKSKIIKKTLDPVWNEQVNVPIKSMSRSELVFHVFDWDRAGDNDDLGQTSADLKAIEPNKKYDWDLKLNTQGSIKVHAYFEPQYVKPDVEVLQRGAANVPLKAVEHVGHLGRGFAGVAGVGASVATGGVRKGGNLLKAIGSNIVPHPGSRKSMESTRASRRLSQTSKSYEETYNNNDDTIVSDNARTRLNQEDVRQNDEVPPEAPKLLEKDVQLQSTEGNATQGVSQIIQADTITTEPGVPASQLEANISDQNEKGLSEHKSHLNKTVLSHIRHRHNSNSNHSHHGHDSSLTILSCQGLNGTIQLRVSLLHDGSIREIHKTENKTVNKQGIATFNESCEFTNNPNASLLLTCMAHHRIGKNRDIGDVEIQLNDPRVLSAEPFTVSLADEQGQITVLVKLG